MDIKAAGTQTDIQSVLNQMRALRAQAEMGTRPIEAQSEVLKGEAARDVDFGATLKNAIDSVNNLQQTASTSANDFISGKRADLVNVMVDGQKASLGFQAMVQVRNRMVSAYQDIMNMPI